MLNEIRISNLGVIEDAVLELGPGLTVLSGETGAGKTMVVSSLGLLLGARSDSALVRDGAEKAVVEGVLDLPADHPARARAKEAGADEDGDLILVRTVSAQGRSRAHVGGRTAPVSVLTDLGELLVAVHGQADQWRLRHNEEHRDLLDAFGGPALARAFAAYRNAFDQHARAQAELTELSTRGRERAQEAAALQVGLERIERLDPAPGEDRALSEEGQRLGHIEELRAAASLAVSVVAGDDDTYAAGAPGTLGDLARAKTALEQVRDSDPHVGELADRLAGITHQLNDLASDLSSYLASLDVEPGRLEWVMGRRADLTELTRLYGDTIDDVLAWAGRSAQRLGTLIGDDDRIGALQQRVADLDAERQQAAVALTTAREKAAKTLARAITQELSQLAMGSARVEVQVRPLGRLGASGADEVEVLMAANLGGTARSVTKAASGGELSRVMLAIEVATAGQGGDTPTFVFDEVDAGVGGRAALAIGSRLSQLATGAQVIVVTHLAQVAAYADRHLVVAKSDNGHVTSSDVQRVDGEARVAELARMLSGSVSDAALEHARDLLTEVQASR